MPYEHDAGAEHPGRSHSRVMGSRYRAAADRQSGTSPHAAVKAEGGRYRIRTCDPYGVNVVL